VTRKCCAGREEHRFTAQPHACGTSCVQQELACKSIGCDGGHGVLGSSRPRGTAFPAAGEVGDGSGDNYGAGSDDVRLANPISGCDDADETGCAPRARGWCAAPRRHKLAEVPWTSATLSKQSAVCRDGGSPLGERSRFLRGVEGWVHLVKPKETK